MAGIHGGSEGNAIKLANQFINYLTDEPESIPPDITLFIIPVLNPDGEARGNGSNGRLNENGVDLNRNWPYNWQSQWDQDGCWRDLPVSAGTHPASEPETMSLMFFLQHHPIDAMISYHCCALGVFAGGVPPYQPSIDLAEMVSGMSSYQFPPTDTGCPYFGNLTDWASSIGIASVDLELTDPFSTEFEQNARILRSFLEWRPISP